MLSHLAMIREMPCILCEVLGRPQQGLKVDAHHVRIWEGAAQRAHDELAIPLCHNDCHQGPHGVHGDKALLAIAKVDEGDLLAATVRKLMGRQPPRNPAPKRSAKTLPRNKPDWNGPEAA